MDALASTQSTNGQTRWFSINWDGWMLEGDPLAVEQAKSDPVILPEEGTEALERILAADDVNQVLVSTSELGRRLEQWVSPIRSHREKSATPASPSHPRPSVSTLFEAPAEGKEQYLAEIWRDLLGLDQIGANDNFFELGGHSLLAIQVISRLRDAWGRNIGVRVLFDHPTVRELAAALEEKHLDLATPEMSALLEKVEHMSDEEARALLGTGHFPSPSEGEI
jgi:acyl carrier protein